MMKACLDPQNALVINGSLISVASVPYVFKSFINFQKLRICKTKIYFGHISLNNTDQWLIRGDS